MHTLEKTKEQIDEILSKIDTTLWAPQISTVCFTQYGVQEQPVTLRWIGGNQRCDLPEGIYSCAGMFKGFEFGEGFYFGDFDTSKVTDMSLMFANANIPEGFKFRDSNGKSFDTSAVVTMKSMFSSTKFGDGVKLPDTFDVSQVRNMSGMFQCAKFGKGFSLGKSFSTDLVLYMDNMFDHAELNESFSLGDKFFTGKVVTMERMFSNTVLPDGFSLGEEFYTDDLEYAQGMFYNCTLGRDFSFGEHFIINSEEVDVESMFASVYSNSNGYITVEKGGKCVYSFNADFDEFAPTKVEASTEFFT